MFEDLVVFQVYLNKNAENMSEQWRDSIHKIFLPRLFKKYNIDSASLRATIRYYFSNVDTFSAFLHDSFPIPPLQHWGDVKEYDFLNQEDSIAVPVLKE